VGHIPHIENPQGFADSLLHELKRWTGRLAGQLRRRQVWGLWGLFALEQTGRYRPIDPSW